jgi:hypothetical protein
MVDHAKESEYQVPLITLEFSTPTPIALRLPRAATNGMSPHIIPAIIDGCVASSRDHPTFQTPVLSFFKLESEVESRGISRMVGTRRC